MTIVQTLALAVGMAVLPADAAVDAKVLIARETAWRSYFAGDVKTLGDLLPPEFIGLGMNDEPFGDRATTLADSQAFHERGGRLVSLSFPETRQQRYGDTVVLYGRFEAVIESGGKQAHDARPPHGNVRAARRQVVAPRLASRPGLDTRQVASRDTRFRPRMLVDGDSSGRAADRPGTARSG